MIKSTPIAASPIFWCSATCWLRRRLTSLPNADCCSVSTCFFCWYSGQAAPFEQALDPSRHHRHDVGHVVTCQPRRELKLQRTIFLGKHAVHHQRMDVHVQILSKGGDRVCCGAAVGRLRRRSPPRRPITSVPLSRAGRAVRGRSGLSSSGWVAR